MLGNVDAGKSTLCGVLTHGELDNGAGKARLNLFRHLHEIQSGHTSSISREILGFDQQGRVNILLQLQIPCDVLNFVFCLVMNRFCQIASSKNQFH